MFPVNVWCSQTEWKECFSESVIHPVKWEPNQRQVFIIIFKYFIVPYEEFGLPYLDKAQDHHYPFLPVCAVFLCVKTMVWLPVFGILNVSTDVNAYNCTWAVWAAYQNWHLKRLKMLKYFNLEGTFLMLYQYLCKERKFLQIWAPQGTVLLVHC